MKFIYAANDNQMSVGRYKCLGPNQSLVRSQKARRRVHRSLPYFFSEVRLK